MEVRLFATLRPLAGASKVTLPDVAAEEPVGDLIRRLIAVCPGLQGEILNASGDGLLPHVHVFINGRSVRDLQGLATPVPAGTSLAIFPPVAGG